MGTGLGMVSENEYKKLKRKEKKSQTEGRNTVSHSDGRAKSTEYESQELQL